MPEAPTTAEFKDDLEPIMTPVLRKRLLWGSVVLLVVVIMAVVPPLISVSRYQKRVASGISQSLGRPVHFDNITLHLLPLPGLTIQNFVVAENPLFGAEPVLRANTVEVRLRLGSLWRRRIEVSRISLDSPSINLVRRRDGSGWNLQSILTQAAQMNSAPTAQTNASDAPRFPYIEATDARINIKSGVDKLPFSIKEAEFSLWLPQPNQWQLRFTGKPVRTDTDVSDVGLLHVEGTLGRAAKLMEMPIDLAANWKPTPLGEAAKLTAGYDLGWRGEASAEASMKGTLGEAKVNADLHLLSLRRADFVPAQTAQVNAHCEATEQSLLHTLTDVRCAVPTSEDTSLFSAIDQLRKLPAPDPAKDASDGVTKPGVLVVRGEVPNTLDANSISLQASLHDAEAGYALAWARLFSKRIPKDVTLGGTLDLSASLDAINGDTRPWSGIVTCSCVLPAWKPEASTETKATKDTKPVATENRWTLAMHHDGEHPAAFAGMTLLAYPQPLGPDGKVPQTVPMVPAGSLISGRVSRGGYLLIYGSDKTAQNMASVLPPLGDDMPKDAAGPMQAQRAWTDRAQSWTAVASAPAASAKPKRHAR